jgi:hypothetical protein
MRHGTSNANGHGMPCDEGFPISAASTDTVGRIPPTCQHLMLRVSSEEGSSLFCTLLFQKNLDRSKLWSFSYLDFRYRNPNPVRAQLEIDPNVRSLELKPVRVESLGADNVDVDP